MRTLLRVRMDSLTVASEELPEPWRLLGGRALTSAIVAAEVPATCHPLSASNKVVIAPGLLSGTVAPCSGRISVGTKSPLTGTIKESNAGGIGAQTMGRLGIPSIGFAPGLEELAHTTQEHVKIEDLVKATAVYSLMPEFLLK